MRAVVLLALVGVAMAAVHQHKLMRIEPTMKKMLKQGTWKYFVEARRPVRAQRLKKVGGVLASTSQNVADYLDEEYIGNVTIGTPDQTFLAILDTGSSNFWVPDTTCGSGGGDCDEICSELGDLCDLVCDDTCCAKANPKNRLFKKLKKVSRGACDGKNHFDSTQSSTYQADGTSWSIEYGTGSASGFQGVDTVRFGSVNEQQLVVPKTTFGQATSIASFFAGDPLDGILGLAFTSLSVNNVPPVLVNAISQGLLDQPLFTVYLMHDGNQQDGQFGGVFTYGGIDTTNCGDIIAYQPLSSATYFQFKMASVSIGSYNSAKNWDVISDTGTSFLGAPQAQSDGIAQVAGGEWDDWNEVYWIDCDKVVPDLSLTIGSNTYTITNVNTNVPAGDDESCLIALFPFDFGGFGPSWILGDPFIRQYCNIYDIGQQRIGFAPSKQP